MIKLLQSLLRGAFMRVEALFNRAFGDRLNPFYQLGAIAFLLFWIVAGSGLYLYVFFETGVADLEIPELVLQNDGHVVGILVEQALADADAGRAGDEGDEEVVFTGQAGLGNFG